MWEVIEALEMYEVPIVSLTSDGAKANRRFYQICAKDYVKKFQGQKAMYHTKLPIRMEV